MPTRRRPAPLPRRVRPLREPVQPLPDLLVKWTAPWPARLTRFRWRFPVLARRTAGDGSADGRVEALLADRLDQAGLLELLVDRRVQPGDDQRDAVAAQVAHELPERLEPRRVGVRHR